jgi:hypothetical protein
MNINGSKQSISQSVPTLLPLGAALTALAAHCAAFVALLTHSGDTAWVLLCGPISAFCFTAGVLPLLPAGSEATPASKALIMASIASGAACIWAAAT